ncbi:MAG: STAS domain-containing protein [Mycobacterium sp.]|nr:STAS domain-containing protein [Mycobacterium sp.]
MSMYLTATATDRELTIHCSGGLDICTGRHLPKILNRLYAQRLDRVTLDLADVDFCDCAGLSALLDVHHLITDFGSEPMFIGATAAVRRLIRTAEYEWLFSTQDPLVRPAAA